MRFQKWHSLVLAVLLLLLFAPLALAADNPSPFDDSNGGPNAGAAACAGIFGCGGGILGLAFAVFVIASLWVIFTKAGKPGWAAIVPIYNLFVLTEIAEKPLLFFILCLVPCVNIIMMFIINIEVAKKFGKDPLYGVGMALLPFIFLPMLAFGKAQYQGTGVMPPS